MLSGQSVFYAPGFSIKIILVTIITGGFCRKLRHSLLIVFDLSFHTDGIGVDFCGVISQGDNADFELILANHQDVFGVQPSQGSESLKANIFVKNASHIDFDTEPKQYVLHVSVAFSSSNQCCAFGGVTYVCSPQR